jgi:hypothetical protein
MDCFRFFVVDVFWRSSFFSCMVRPFFLNFADLVTSQKSRKSLFFCYLPRYELSNVDKLQNVKNAKNHKIFNFPDFFRKFGSRELAKTRISSWQAKIQIFGKIALSFTFWTYKRLSRFLRDCKLLNPGRPGGYLPENWHFFPRCVTRFFKMDLKIHIFELMYPPKMAFFYEKTRTKNWGLNFS